MAQRLRFDRARGTLLGLAVGDALGAPLEGLTLQQIRSAYGTVVDYVNGVRAWPKKPFRWRSPGLYSDDTQQALILAECLLRHHAIQPDWIANAYVELANPRGLHLGAHRGAGKSFRGVVAELEKGTVPLQCGQASAGIGAAMRIAPLGLYYMDQPLETLRDAVIEASLVTHRDIRSLAGAIAVAYAVQRLARGESREPSFLFKLAHDVAQAEDFLVQNHSDHSLKGRDHRRSISIAIAHVESMLELEREQAYIALIEEARRHGPDQDCRRPTHGFAPALIPCTLYVLFSTESFEEAITEIVNLGGDADTAGAILGAMAGTHYGDSAIPTRWLDGLQNRDGISRRAESLVAPNPQLPSDTPDLIGTERRLSELETTLRESLMARRQSEDDLGANRRR